MHGLRVYEGVKLVKLGGFVVFYYMAYTIYILNEEVLWKRPPKKPFHMILLTLISCGTLTLYFKGKDTLVVTNC